MIKNKRADLPVFVLVIGIVGICILTILSFVKFNNDLNEDFLGIGLIETMLSIEEELKLYDSTDFKGDYGNLFERGNVEITIEGKKVLKGKYAVQECTFLGFGCENKKMVFIEYKK